MIAPDGSSTEPERLPAFPCAAAEAAQRPSEKEESTAIEVRTIDQPLVVRARKLRSKTLRQECQSIPEDAANSCARCCADCGKGRRWPTEEVICNGCSKRGQQLQAGDGLYFEDGCGTELGLSDQCGMWCCTERALIDWRRECSLFAREMQRSAVCVAGLCGARNRQERDAQKDDAPEACHRAMATGSADLE